MMNVLKDLNRRFDHAALMPQTTEADIVTLCREAMEHDFYAVAINPVWVALARETLADSRVRILTVCGFPLGASRTDIKQIEALKGVYDGAHEIDMVANIGWLQADDFISAEREIAQIRDNLPHNVALKVIIEAGILTDQRQIEATKAVINGGAQFVKTSTGFFGGATVEQVLRLVETAAGRVEVKASGGIRTLKQCRQMLEAGATRIGSSSSVSIIKELADPDPRM